MKRKTIKQLEEIIDSITKRSEAIETEDINIRRKLTDELEIGALNYGSRDLASWNTIYSKILKMKGKIDGMVLKEAEFLPWIHQEQNQTNAKLWYLLRSAMKDETLDNDISNYIDQSSSSVTPFKKPIF